MSIYRTFGAQPSGHILIAEHIEVPVTEFIVEWTNPSYTNGGITFPTTKRWARVRAKTGKGALVIARYHYARGEDFNLLPTAPNYTTTR